MTWLSRATLNTVRDDDGFDQEEDDMFDQKEEDLFYMFSNTQHLKTYDEEIKLALEQEYDREKTARRAISIILWTAFDFGKRHFCCRWKENSEDVVGQELTMFNHIMDTVKRQIIGEISNVDFADVSIHARFVLNPQTFVKAMDELNASTNREKMLDDYFACFWMKNYREGYLAKAKAVLLCTPEQNDLQAFFEYFHANDAIRVLNDLNAMT